MLTLQVSSRLLVCYKLSRFNNALGSCIRSYNKDGNDLAKPSTSQSVERPPLVPVQPCWIEIDESILPPPPLLTEELVDHLERQSLVRFSSHDAVKHLEKAIRFADQLRLVDVDGVEPMISPFEDTLSTPLRDDVIKEGNCRDKVLQNAQETVEEYFVTPPGNIPLDERLDKLGKK